MKMKEMLRKVKKIDSGDAITIAGALIVVPLFILDWFQGTDSQFARPLLKNFFGIDY